MNAEPSSTNLRRETRPDSPDQGDGDDSLATVRETRPGDFADIFELTKKTYPHDVPWRERELEQHVDNFPSGQLVAVDHRDRVVGMAASLLVRDQDYPTQCGWLELTGNGYFGNHDPDGDILYAADVMVDPSMRGKGVGKALYEARRKLTRRHLLKGIRATARLRGYHRHADLMDPVSYAREVVQGRIGDPTLSFQLKQGFLVRGIIRDFKDDPETLGYAAVIHWPAFEMLPRRTTRISAPVAVSVR